MWLKFVEKVVKHPVNLNNLLDLKPYREIIEKSQTNDSTKFEIIMKWFNCNLPLNFGQIHVPTCNHVYE